MLGNKKGLGREFMDLWHSPSSLVRIIVFNCVLFVLVSLGRVFMRLGDAISAYDWFISKLALPASLDSLSIQPWSLISYAFLHQGFLHLLFNMLVLYWFGRLLVEYLGERHIRALYLLGALVAGVGYILIYNTVPYYADLTERTILLGASGSVYAIVLATAVLVPDYSFYLIFIGPVRIKYIAAAYVFLSFLGIAGGNSGGALAHLGGALLGWIYIVQLKKGMYLGAPIDAVFDLFRPTNKTPKKQNASTNKYASAKKTKKKNTPKTTDSQHDIDAILDKISASGYDSLSREEKEILFRMSKKK